MSERFGGPAPLLAAPGAPIPPGGEALWLEGAAGVRLRAALFQPTASLRGSVALSGGRTEFIEKYFEVIRELQGRGFVVLVHDWRGQGLSDRLHGDALAGHVRAVDDYLHDWRAMLDLLEPRLPRPWINLAHSMGAGLTTLAVAEGEARFAGHVLTAPLFGLAKRLPGWLVRGLNSLSTATAGQRRWAMRIEPGGGWARLTSDERRRERWRGQLAAHPQLALGGFTHGWLRAALSLCDRLDDAALRRVSAPTVLLRAGVEDLVDNARIGEAAALMPNARLVDAPDSWHELMMERDAVRAIFWRAFDDLADELAPSAPSA